MNGILCFFVNKEITRLASELIKNASFLLLSALSTSVYAAAFITKSACIY